MHWTRKELKTRHYFIGRFDAFNIPVDSIFQWINSIAYLSAFKIFECNSMFKLQLLLLTFDKDGRTGQRED